MIFNSISKELSQSRYSNRQRTGQTEGSYFPQQSPAAPSFLQPSTPVHHIQQSTPLSTARESALSKMNQRITENIDYLRFKDQLRNSELRSSRASVRSNHSQRSHNSQRPKHSVSKVAQPAQHHTYEPMKPIKLEGKGGIHYYRPQNSSSSSNLMGQSSPSHQLVTRSVLERNPSQTAHTFKPTQSMLGSQVEPVRGLTATDSAKEFTRKPITIDTSNVVVNKHSGYMMGSRPEKDKGTPSELRTSSMKSSEADYVDMEEIRASLLPKRESHRSSFGVTPRLPSQEDEEDHKTPLEWKGVQSWREGLDEFKEEPPQQSLVKVTATVPDSPPLPKTLPSPRVETKASPAPVSPLPKKSPPKVGLIVAAGLIALGLIILLLQLSK